MNKPTETICQTCGNTFPGYASKKSKYCTRDCYYASLRKDWNTGKGYLEEVPEHIASNTPVAMDYGFDVKRWVNCGNTEKCIDLKIDAPAFTCEFCPAFASAKPEDIVVCRTARVY